MAIVIIRTAMIYFALLLAMRLMGKRQLGEMELSEFVVASLIADLAAHPLQDPDRGREHEEHPPARASIRQPECIGTPWCDRPEGNARKPLYRR